MKVGFAAVLPRAEPSVPARLASVVLPSSHSRGTVDSQESDRSGSCYNKYVFAVPRAGYASIKLPMPIAFILT